MADLVLRDITKVYPGGVESVRRANIEIADKSFTIVVGPSGSGKSTVLRMIAGLEEITSGDLTIDGQRVNDVPPKDRDIAFVFQNYALYPHLSVYENMAFGLRLRGVPKAEIDRRVREAAALLQLEPYLERKPKALSGGQRQRVAVGRAIVRNPRVFLFDEPLSNLDAKLRVEMRTELARLHRRLGATIVYVTHDQVEAMTLGDRIVVMRDGVVQQIGAPLELYERPVNRFVAGFIGSPPMNFFDATAARSNGGVFVEGEGFRLRVTPEQEAALGRRGLLGKRVVFGVRPEHIHDRLFLPDAPPDRTLRAAVDVVEPMGAETYVHVRIGPRISTIRLGGESIPKEGQEMELVLEMGRSHLFDAESEETVG